MRVMKNNLKTLLASSLFIAVPLFISCDPVDNEAPVPLTATGIADKKATSVNHNKVLAEARQGTARYHRVKVAMEDGYVITSDCVAIPSGGMGYHFTKFALVDGIIDPSEPEVLVYEPQKNGKLKLVAVEYIVPSEAWDPMHSEPPMLGQMEFDDHRAPGSPGPPFPHYELHAWIWKHNPAGMHAPFNPNVSCEFATE